MRRTDFHALAMPLQMVLLVSCPSVLAASPDSCEAADQIALGRTPAASINRTESPAIRTVINEGATCKLTATTITSDQTGLTQVRSGEILVIASRPVTVKTQLCSLHIESGAMALITVKSNVVHVSNVFETKRQSVHVSAPSAANEVLLSVGQELIVADDYSGLGEKIGNDSIGRRRVRSWTVAGQAHFVRSEISLVSLMQKSAVLTCLLKSADEQDRNILSKIVKTAACVALVTAGHGPYALAKF